MVVNKRGLSQVVTILLIILLVLAAVGIIWAAVRPAITKSAGQITAGCITLDIIAESCAGAASPVSVTVKRGADDTELKSIKFVFTDGTNSDVTEVITSTFGALETEQFSVSYSGLGAGTIEVDVAGVIIIGDNQEKTCSARAAPVSCV